MTFKMGGHRYRINTELWKERMGWLAVSALVWGMLIMPIALYMAPRW